MRFPAALDSVFSASVIRPWQIFHSNALGLSEIARALPQVVYVPYTLASQLNRFMLYGFPSCPTRPALTTALSSTSRAPFRAATACLARNSTPCMPPRRTASPAPSCPTASWCPTSTCCGKTGRSAKTSWAFALHGRSRNHRHRRIFQLPLQRPVYLFHRKRHAVALRLFLFGHVHARQ